MLHTTAGRVNLTKNSVPQNHAYFLTLVGVAERAGFIGQHPHVELNPFAMPALIGQPTGPLVRV